MYFNINISHYFFRAGFKSLFERYWSLSKNKGLELQLIYNSHMLLAIELNLMFGGRDHGGPEICLGLLGLEIRMEMPDRRHWNREENRWETEAEMQAWSDKYSDKGE